MTLLVLKRVTWYAFLGFLICSIFSLVCIVSNEGEANFEYKPFRAEKYNPLLFGKIKSIQDLSDTLNNLAKELAIGVKSLQYMELANELVEKRFCFGYSYYNYSNNPYVKVLGDYIWSDLSAIVIPDDLMQYNHAACSQQSIILMELLKTNGFDVRKVGLIGHFCLEAKLGEHWYFFDPTFEPNFNNQTSKREFNEFNMLFIENSYSKTGKLVRFTEYTVGESNTFPAPRIIILHKFTRFMLYFGPLIFASITVFGFWYHRKLSSSFGINKNQSFLMYFTEKPLFANKH